MNGQRAQSCGGARPRAVAMLLQLRLQRQKPTPTIRPLEAARGGLRKISAFNCDILCADAFVEQGRDLSRARQIGITADDPRQKPIAVDARVPVIAAEEDRMQRAGALHVVRARHDVIELVGIFAPDMRQH